MASVVDAERRGELLLTFDLVERALVEYPGDVELEFRAVLALARSGSTAEAARRFEEYGLATASDEDTQALSARIKKDAALAAEGEEGRRLALQAALEYRKIYDQTGGYFPAVNAATLTFLAGDREAAAELAADALRAAVESGDESYYALRDRGRSPPGTRRGGAGGRARAGRDREHRRLRRARDPRGASCA